MEKQKQEFIRLIRGKHRFLHEHIFKCGGVTELLIAMECSSPERKRALIRNGIESIVKILPKPRWDAGMTGEQFEERLIRDRKIMMRFAQTLFDKGLTTKKIFVGTKFRGNGKKMIFVLGDFKFMMMESNEQIVEYFQLLNCDVMIPHGMFANGFISNKIYDMVTPTIVTNADGLITEGRMILRESGNAIQDMRKDVGDSMQGINESNEKVSTMLDQIKEMMTATGDAIMNKLKGSWPSWIAELLAFVMDILITRSVTKDWKEVMKALIVARLVRYTVYAGFNVAKIFTGLIDYEVEDIYKTQENLNRMQEQYNQHSDDAASNIMSPDIRTTLRFLVAIATIVGICIYNQTGLFSEPEKMGGSIMKHAKSVMACVVLIPSLDFAFEKLLEYTGSLFGSLKRLITGDDIVIPIGELSENTQKWIYELESLRKQNIVPWLRKVCPEDKYVALQLAMLGDEAGFNDLPTTTAHILNYNVERLYFRGTQILEQIKGKKDFEGLAAVVNEHLIWLRKHHEVACNSYVKTATGMRMEPMCIVLTGDPGQGKSVLVEQLCKAWFNILGVEDPSCIQHCMDSEVYWHTQDKYWNGYFNQEVYVKDDAGQMPASSALPDPFYMDMIRMVNTTPFNIPMADISEKRRCFSSRLLIITSNSNLSALAEDGGVNFPDAFKRRITLKIDVSALDKYRTNGILDPAKVKQHLNTAYSSEVYSFKALDPMNVETKSLRTVRILGETVAVPKTFGMRTMYELMLKHYQLSGERHEAKAASNDILMKEFAAYRESTCDVQPNEECEEENAKDDDCPLLDAAPEIDTYVENSNDPPSDDEGTAVDPPAVPSPTPINSSPLGSPIPALAASTESPVLANLFRQIEQKEEDEWVRTEQAPRLRAGLTYCPNGMCCTDSTCLIYNEHYPGIETVGQRLVVKYQLIYAFRIGRASTYVFESDDVVWRAVRSNPLALRELKRSADARHALRLSDKEYCASSVDDQIEFELEKEEDLTLQHVKAAAYVFVKRTKEAVVNGLRRMKELAVEAKNKIRDGVKAAVDKVGLTAIVCTSLLTTMVGLFVYVQGTAAKGDADYDGDTSFKFSRLAKRSKAALRKIGMLPNSRDVELVIEEYHEHRRGAVNHGNRRSRKIDLMEKKKVILDVIQSCFDTSGVSFNEIPELGPNADPTTRNMVLTHLYKMCAATYAVSPSRYPVVLGNDARKVQIGSGRCGTLTFIKGNQAVTAAHVCQSIDKTFDASPENTVILTNLVHKAGIVVERSEFSWTMLTQHDGTPTDFALVTIDPRIVSTHADLTPFIDFDSTKVGMDLVYRTISEDLEFDTHEGMVVPTPCVTASRCFYTEPRQGERRFRDLKHFQQDFCTVKDHYLLQNPGSPGDSGGLVFSIDKSCNLKLRGIYGGTPKSDPSKGLVIPFTMEKSSFLGSLTAIEEEYVQAPVNAKTEFYSSHEGGDVSFIQTNEKFSLRQKTELEPSLFAGVIEPVKTAPAMLHQANGIHPKKKATEKYARSNHNIPTEKVEKASQETINTWKSVAQTRVPHLIGTEFTMDQSVNGHPTEDYAPGINGDASCGSAAKADFERLHPGRKATKNKDILECTCAGTYCAIFDHYLDLVKTCVRNKKRIPVIWNDSMKDEKRPIPKVHAGKTRLFNCVNHVGYVAVFKKYFGSFIAAVTSSKISAGPCVGLNPYDMRQWTKLRRKLAKFGENNVFAGDFGGFDASQNSKMLKSFVDKIIAAFYPNASEESNAIRRALWLEICESIHSTGQGTIEDIYKWLKGQPSGNPMTTIINCFINETGMRMVYNEIMGELVKQYPFNDHVVHLTYGDDSLTAVSVKVKHLFNQRTVAETFAKFGFEYTDELKQGAEAIVETKHIDEVNFLKRSFKAYPVKKQNQLFMAPIAQSAIHAMLEWVRMGGAEDNKAIYREEMSFIVAGNALREASLHDEMYFYHLRDSIVAKAKSLGLYEVYQSYLPMDWTSTRDRVLESDTFYNHL